MKKNFLFAHKQSVFKKCVIDYKLSEKMVEMKPAFILRAKRS